MTRPRTMRRGAAAALLLALPLALLGCASEEAADDPTEPSPPSAPADADEQPRDSEADHTVRTRSTGMDVRTLNPDGSASTVPVRDFPR